MRKLLSGMLSLCFCALMSISAFAQSNSITNISFPNDSAVAEENLSVSGYGDKESGYAPLMLGGRLYASVSGTDYRKLEWSKGEYQGVGMQPVMTGGTKNPWGNGAYPEIRLSTKGYENIAFSASIGATKKGPRDYKLQYSPDGVNFTDVAGQIFSIPVNKTMYKAFDEVSLPAETADADELYIRIVVASNMTVGGTAGLIGSTSGETAINNILVSGTPLPVPTTVQVGQTTTAVSDESTTTSSAATSATASIVPNTSTTTTSRIMESVKTGETSDGVLFAAVLLLVAVGGILLAKRIRV